MERTQIQVRMWRKQFHEGRSSHPTTLDSDQKGLVHQTIRAEKLCTLMK